MKCDPEQVDRTMVQLVTKQVSFPKFQYVTSDTQLDRVIDNVLKRRNLPKETFFHFNMNFRDQVLKSINTQINSSVQTMKSIYKGEKI